MPYLISILAFFMFPTAHASCLKENTIENQFLVVTSQELPTSFSTKTNSRVLIQKKISSSKSSLSVLSKTGIQKKSATYLVHAQSMTEVKAAYPNAQIQVNCEIEFLSASSDGPDTFQNFQNWYFNSLNQSSSIPLNPLREIIIAISDTGVDVDHIDLQGNLWTNQAELNGSPNIDDDNNGYIDDIYGYDFGDNDSNPKPTINDFASDFNHGTHVAGLVGARALNSEGIAGVSLNTVKIMSLKGFKSNAKSTISDLLETIYYAVDNGAHIINTSWGSKKDAEAAEIEAVNYAVQNGVVIVAAAGNSRVPASWFVPASIKNVITVSSINSSDELSTFSNYGSSINFVSPGGDGGERNAESLLSLGVETPYLELRGTSMSAPLVSGLLGALMSQKTSLTAFQAVHVLEQSGKKLILQPYLQSSNIRTYTKPDFLNALNFLNTNSNIPDIKPDLENVGSFSRSSAKPSKGSGCSNSLSEQPHSTSGSIESRPSPVIIVLMLIPILTILGIKKGL